MTLFVFGFVGCIFSREGFFINVVVGIWVEGVVGFLYVVGDRLVTFGVGFIFLFNFGVKVVFRRL